MRKHKWLYAGNIDAVSYGKNCNGKTTISEIQLGDLDDSSKAPVLLHCGPGLVGYIVDVLGHDDEEKYMRKEFLYDDILCIREIRVLNSDGKVCKIIRDMEDFNHSGLIVGPRSRINDRNHKALTLNAEDDFAQIHHFFGHESFAERNRK